jgi:hypothetical protein
MAKKDLKNEASQGVVKVSKAENGMQVVDVNASVPSLESAQVAPIDLMSDYWTPEKVGESKRMFFMRIGQRNVIDQQDQSKVIALDCAFFVENVNGEVRSISNGSKRLVGALESINAQQGMPFLITYLGKKRNRNNSFSSDNWSVKPLVVTTTVVGEGVE